MINIMNLSTLLYCNKQCSCIVTCICLAPKHLLNTHVYVYTCAMSDSSDYNYFYDFRLYQIFNL